MTEPKGKKLLVKVILGLLITGALSYGYLPKAYCPLEDKTVRYIHLSESRKTATKIIPDDVEGWKVLDDRCQKGMEIGQWIPIDEGLINNCQSALEECQAREFELCGECPEVLVETCPDEPPCPVLPAQNGSCSPCIQTCDGCGGGGGSCPPTTCSPCVNCDKVNTLAYIPDEDCNIVQKYFCDGIGYDAECYEDGNLEMPFG